MCVAGLAYLREYAPVQTPPASVPFAPLEPRAATPEEEAATIEAIRKAILD
jgi:hypothetical protein